MTGLTQGIAEFIVRTTAADFPPELRDKAKKVVVDTFAAIVGSAKSDVAAPLFRYLDDSGETGTSPILGTGRRSSPELAALVNGTFGAALEFDDVLSMMPGHPSAVVIAALIAGLRPGELSGARLLEAYAIGVEVGAKIATGITIGHYHRGFHVTGTLALFSAVAALAKAKRLDVAATRNAFGIAASMSAGLRRNFGTMVKPLHSGWAARSAIAAVALTRSGFTAADDALEGDAGYFAAYGVEKSDPQATLDALGRPWMFLQPGVTLKKFPCCYASHRAIDGLQEIKRELALTPANLGAIRCRVAPGALLALVFPDPKNGLEAKFSMNYALAAGILDERYTLATFTDAAVRREALAPLMARIRVSEDDACRGDDPLFDTRSSATRGFVLIEAETTDGRKAARKVLTPPGHPLRELTWAEMREKFAICAREADVAADREREAYALLESIETTDDVARIVALLA